MRVALLFMCFATSFQPAFADGDAVAGKAVFSKCAACHSRDTPKNRVGPHLMGIVGRPAASVPDYTKYSDAMRKAGADGLVWDEAMLAKYLAGPKVLVPGTKMMFPGLKSPGDIANLIAYLETAAAP